MTALARISSSIPALDTRSTNGASSRPAVFILSKPWRATETTVALRRRCGAISGSSASGFR